MAPPSQTAFTCFPKLPTEIRLMIWDDVCFFPRNIDLWVLYHGQIKRRLRGRSNTFDCNRYVSICPHPSILHANRESRAVGLKYYELAFGMHTILDYGMEFSTPARIYVNWNSDVIIPMAIDQSDRFDWPDHFFGGNLPIQNLAMSIEDTGMIWATSLWFELPLKNVILYHLEHPFQQNSLELYRPNFKLELLPFDYTMVEKELTRVDGAGKSGMERVVADLEGHHISLREQQTIWDEEGRPDEERSVPSYIDGAEDIEWSPKALMNRLPCPDISFAELRVNNGEWTSNSKHQYKHKPRVVIED